MKSVYGMSEAGKCPRVLGAKRLGYDPLPRTAADEEQLKHYTRLEKVAAEQIMDRGLILESADRVCATCRSRYGVDRMGIHVEIDTPMFMLVGHLDRRLILGNGKTAPVEIKSLGKTFWSKFAQHEFVEFPEYAGQECCYLEAEQSPGVYWVMERDSGANLRYMVNGDLGLPDFKPTTLPVTFDQIVEKLDMVEICAMNGQLMDGVPNDLCWFCQYKFLCIKQKADIGKEEDQPHLVAAADTYQTALEMEKDAKALKSNATTTLLDHSKKNHISKYRVGDLSVTYRGQRTKTSVDADKLRQENQELYNLCLKTSQPFDDYTIRPVGQNK